jgi:hypothetical protein
MWEGLSPYKRLTYRYPPLLAAMLTESRLPIASPSRDGTRFARCLGSFRDDVKRKSLPKPRHSGAERVVPPCLRQTGLHLLRPFGGAIHSQHFAETWRGPSCGSLVSQLSPSPRLPPMPPPLPGPIDSPSPVPWRRALAQEVAAASRCTAAWLFNPVVINVSTRGNADAVVRPQQQHQHTLPSSTAHNVPIRPPPSAIDRCRIRLDAPPHDARKPVRTVPPHVLPPRPLSIAARMRAARPRPNQRRPCRMPSHVLWHRPHRPRQ